MKPLSTLQGSVTRISASSCSCGSNVGLIAARVIATYVHIGAELCIVDEQDGPAGYQARVTGQHTYFTNDKHVEPLAFTVTIDPAGVIAVRGD